MENSAIRLSFVSFQPSYEGVFEYVLNFYRTMAPVNDLVCFLCPKGEMHDSHKARFLILNNGNLSQVLAYIREQCTQFAAEKTDKPHQRVYLALAPIAHETIDALVGTADPSSLSGDSLLICSRLQGIAKSLRSFGISFEKELEVGRYRA